MDSQRPDHLTEERYLDVHEAAEILEVSEDELWGLVRHHQVPSHNIAGAFLRFKKEDIEELKIKWRIERELFPKKQRYFAHESTVQKADWHDRLRDFWYFNDFYVFCSVLSVALLYFIIASQ
jgi:predicted DNA-binding transcriptional regulator AlpA